MDLSLFVSFACGINPESKSVCCMVLSFEKKVSKLLKNVKNVTTFALGPLNLISPKSISLNQMHKSPQ